MGENVILYVTISISVVVGLIPLNVVVSAIVSTYISTVIGEQAVGDSSYVDSKSSYKVIGLMI